MTDAVEKGFAKDQRAISIQDQAQIRNLDSKNGMPRFDNFKIQFYSSILDTFSTASTRFGHRTGSGLKSANPRKERGVNLQLLVLLAFMVPPPTLATNHLVDGAPLPPDAKVESMGAESAVQRQSERPPTSTHCARNVVECGNACAFKLHLRTIVLHLETIAT